MQRSKRLLGGTIGVLLAGIAHAVAAQGEIKIGEINSYSLLPAFTEPYRKGRQLAVEEINAAGGVDGKKLVVVSKDDGGKPADAQTAANELVSSENVVMLTGWQLAVGKSMPPAASTAKLVVVSRTTAASRLTTRRAGTGTDCSHCFRISGRCAAGRAGA